MLLSYTRLFIVSISYFTRAYYVNRYVPAPEIAEYYNMNSRALMPALKQLTRSGILRSRVGGREPGFIFSRDPGEIKLMEVIAALEGENRFECCRDLIGGVKCECADRSKCKVFQILNHAILDTMNRLSKVSLRDYCDNKEDIKLRQIV